MGIFIAISMGLGFILFLLNILLFDTFASNFTKITFGLVSLIPAIGVFIMLLSIGWDASHYKHSGFGSSIYTNEVYVRRTKLNRWLFNDINWKEWDEYIERCKRFDDPES